jgi:hypothetical protein
VALANNVNLFQQSLLNELKITVILFSSIDIYLHKNEIKREMHEDKVYGMGFIILELFPEYVLKIEGIYYIYIILTLAGLYLSLKEIKKAFEEIRNSKR